MAAYIHFCSKPKNRPPIGWTPEQTKADFLVKEQDPLVIVDYEGQPEEYGTRIGVKVNNVQLMGCIRCC